MGDGGTEHDCKDAIYFKKFANLDGRRLETLGGAPGCEAGVPDSLTDDDSLLPGTHEMVAGAPGSLAGAPDSLVEAPGSLIGSPGKPVGAPGRRTRVPGRITRSLAGLTGCQGRARSLSSGQS